MAQPPMDALDCLTGRRSISRLHEPGPTEADLQTMLDAAVCAPDHAQLRPWRFMVITGEGRARLGETFAEVERERTGGDPGAVEKAAAKPLRAPMIVAVICTPVSADEAWNGKRIPAWEQLAATAAAAQNLCLAAHALGYGSMWRTGSFGDEPVVRDALGMGPDDTVVGWIYLGAIPANATLPERRPTDLEQAVTRWSTAD